MTRRTIFIVVLTSILTAWANAAVVQRDANALEKIDHETLRVEEKVPPMAKIYEGISARLSTADMSALDKADLDDFWRAAKILAFYTSDPAYVRDMRKTFDELARRTIVKPRDREDMQSSYVSARMFIDALHFARLPANQGVLKEPPILRSRASDTDKLTLLQINDDGLVAVQHPVTFSQGVHVLVVGSPACHFSRNAAAAIASDPSLSEMMSRHSTWITPQEAVQNFSAIAEWNQEYPSSPMESVYRQSDWSVFGSWDTPTFYFFKDGKVVATVTGWPGDDQLSNLREGFKAAAEK